MPDPVTPQEGKAYSQSQVEAVLAAPSLTNLGVGHMQWHTISSFPTSRLTSLECWTEIHMGELASLGATCRELKVMKIVVPNSTNQTSVGQPAVFPSLESPDIQSNLSDPSVLLSRMSCPSLIDFAFAAIISRAPDSRPTDAFVASLIAFVRSSRRTLRSFTLSIPHGILPSDHGWLRELLLLSTSVKFFNFTMSFKSHEVDIPPTSALYHLWSLLTIPSFTEGSVLLPHLDTVKMRVENWTYAVNDGDHPGDLSRDIIDRFVRMAESRSRVAVPLHVATLRCAELIFFRTTQMKDPREENAVQRAMAGELDRRREVLVDSGMNFTIEEVLNLRRRWLLCGGSFF
ncbi:hypothetical protein V5O48_004217 [Marasmius crinis-equi]|uniref:F-box domain-containing protein n=1 Tax=Marasmius crinis-equi TaxID=585013 RepID=A0ABR3FQM7_9AGAR